MGLVTGWERFAADMAAVHGEEFVRDFCKSITDEIEAEREVTYAQQRKIAAATARLDEAYLDGLGECHMRVDPEVFWNWVHTHGREIWNDPDFIHCFKRDNPDVRVLSKPRKTTVVRP
jgi:hypothetical protein